MSYPLVNRCAVAVIPELPFWNWVRSTCGPLDQELLDAKPDPNLYLVPDFEMEPDMTTAIEKYIAQNFKDIFISELEGWYADPASFPEITQEVFKDWFRLLSFTMIFDTVTMKLKKE